MKKLTLLLTGGLISALSFAQTSGSENFDSYSSGDYLGIVGAANGWTTWSGSGAGTAEDVQVTNADAQSPNNSIYFDGGPAGGPHDVVLDFGDEYNSGSFHFEMAVKSDSGFYFNLQGNSSIGLTFPFQMYVIDDTIGVDDGQFLFTNIEFTDENQWVTIAVDINLDSNEWVVSWDGTEIASFSNSTINQVAAADFYPLDGDDDWYVDDVAWSWTPTPRVVTFKVDMNYYNNPFTSVAVAGEQLNSWCYNCDLMADNDTDGVWEYTTTIAAEMLHYYFVVDNGAATEDLDSLLPCVEEYAFQSWSRVLALTEDKVLEPVCWEQCDTCSVPAGINATANRAKEPLIYPNPATDQVFLEFGAGVKQLDLRLYDISGRLVSQPFISFSGTRAVVNTAGLTPGSYAVVGNADGLHFNQTLVVLK